MVRLPSNFIIWVVIALPILVGGFLVSRSMEADQAAQHSAQAALMQDQLAFLDHQLQSRIAHYSASKWDRVEGALQGRTDPTMALRHMTVSGQPQLVVIYRGDRRLYPPEDSTLMTMAETTFLLGVRNDLALARDALARGGQALRWLRLNGGMSLLECRDGVVPEQVVCLLLAGDEVLAELQAVLAAYGQAQPLWQVDFQDEEGKSYSGNPLSPSGGGLEGTRLLGEALAGWRLHMVWRGSPSTLGFWPGWSSYVMGGGPMAAFWGLLVWHLYQKQRQQIMVGRQRVELAAQLSHDLRTPLANFGLYLDLLRRRVDDQQAVLRYAQTLEQELARLDRIAVEAVSLAKGEARQDVTEVLNPRAYLEALLQSRDQQFQRAQCAVSLDAGDDLGQCRLNVMTFDRVVGNLLDNACKFAPGTAIDLSLQQQGGDLVLAVRDHGPGIAQADVRQQGSGLGLPSVRSLLEPIGGAVLLEAANPGLRVIVRLPVQGEERA